MRVIDVASYQSTLKMGSISGVDGTIIKATEGLGYVNPHCDIHYQEAVAAKILRGVYHFAANKSNKAVDEARYFVANIKGYVGDAILVLDYENSADNYEGDVVWALTWLQEVEHLTGVKPLIYMNANCVNTHNWSPVIANGNALWVAAYQASAPDVNWPNTAQAGWQFTSTGRVAGYAGNLDISDFWLDKAGWARFAKTSPVAGTPPPAPVTTTTTTVQASPAPTPAPTTTTTTTKSPSSSSPVITTTTTITPMPNGAQAESLWTVLVSVAQKIVAFLQSFKRSK